MREMLLEHPVCCKTNFTVGIIVKQKEFIFQAHESIIFVTYFLYTLIKDNIKNTKCYLLTKSLNNKAIV